MEHAEEISVKAAIYHPKTNYGKGIKAAVLSAFSAGLRAHDVEIETSSILDFVPADVHVIYGFGKAEHEHIEWAAKHHGGRLLVLSPGYIRSSARLDEVTMWAALWDNQHGRGDPCIEQAPADRWDALSIELKPWRSGEYVLLAGQVPTDGQVCHMDIIDWCARKAREIKAWTDKPIVFRPHPLADDVTPNIPGTRRSNRPFKEDLEGAAAVVTYNSQSSSMAVIEGVPVFAFDRGSMAWNVSHHDLGYLDEPLEFDRIPWAHKLAYCQWSFEEFREGAAWDHLRRGAKDKR